MVKSTVLFRARVPEARLRRAEKILARMGLKPADALNMLLAQVELREALPFSVTTQPVQVIDAEAQGGEWTKSIGTY